MQKSMSQHKKKRQSIHTATVFTFLSMMLHCLMSYSYIISLDTNATPQQLYSYSYKPNHSLYHKITYSSKPNAIFLLIKRQRTECLTRHNTMATIAPTSYSKAPTYRPWSLSTKESGRDTVAIPRCCLHITSSTRLLITISTNPDICYRTEILSSSVPKFVDLGEK